MWMKTVKYFIKNIHKNLHIPEKSCTFAEKLLDRLDVLGELDGLDELDILDVLGEIGKLKKKYNYG